MELKLTDIPKFLPNKIRKCADEDGCMTEYKVPVQQDSYIFGYNSALRLIREKIEKLEITSVISFHDSAEEAVEKFRQSILSLLEG